MAIRARQVSILLFTSFLIPFEMLLVNLFVIDSCSKKKYSRAATYGVMGLFSLLIFLLAQIVALYIPPLRQGNGFFVFWGFLFLFPIRFLYHNTYSKIISLACTSWIYTFIVFSFSVHIGKLISFIPLEYSTLGLQTLLYIITLISFRRFLKEKFLVVLAQLTHEEVASLMRMSIVWFWTVFIINLGYIYPEITFLPIIGIFSLAACAINFFRYIYYVTSNNRTILLLEDLAYKDSLTQLRSRTVLQNDAQILIEKQIPFYIIFMDLDQFKSINDTYGHMIGDEYLAFFAKEVKLRLGSRGGFYRIAGDEFVCIYTENDPDAFLDTLSTLPPTLPNRKVAFLGASYGVAHHPSDGETLDILLKTADYNMYAMKQKKADKQPPEISPHDAWSGLLHPPQKNSPSPDSDIKK